MKELAPYLCTLKIWDKADLKKVNKLYETRNYIAHKNTKKIESILSSGITISVLKIDLVVSNFDALPYLLNTIRRERYGYLPTQIPIGQKIMQADNLTSFPYYEEMISMIPCGHSRPNIPEYPEIANHIKQALDNVYNGTKGPKQALDDAAAKSARLLGW